jgi:hypothetical protein
MLSLMVMIFLYVSWNFYKEALSYNPLSGIPEKTRTTDKDTTSISLLEFKTGWSKGILEKNLFSPSRTYIKPKPISEFTIPPPPKRPELVLKGIILDMFGEYVAYIEKDRAKAIPVRKGDSIEDVEVIEVTDRKTILKWNEETIELKMDKIKTISKPR